MSGQTFYICHNLYKSTWPKFRESAEGKTMKNDDQHDPVTRLGSICESCIQRNVEAYNQERARA